MSPVDTAPAMSEAQLLANILELCARLKLRTLHIQPAQIGSRWLTAVNRDGVGFPDLVIAGAGGVLFRELKTDTGRTTPEQDAWIDRLVVAGGNAGVWRPADWRQLRIASQLQNLTARRKQVA